MKLNRNLVLCLALVLSLAMATTGTLAYLQDTDEAVNVMTLGSVHIEQMEYERKVDENGNWIATGEKDQYGYTPDAMQPFTQNKPAMPAVYQNGDTAWDDRNGSQAASGEGSHQQSWAEVGAPGSNQLFDDSMKNVIDKFVFVKNTGKSDAYYRTIIAIECPVGLNVELIHTNTNGNSRFSWENVGYTTIAGVQYFLKVANYNEILTPNEVSRPSLLQLYLDPAATNEDVELFGDTWEVLVVSQAVQADGFKDAATALDAAFGDVTTSSHPWMDWDGKTDAEGDQDPDSVKVATADELVAALTKAGAAGSGNSTIALAANIDMSDVDWTPVYVNGYNGAGVVTVNGNGFTITNLNAPLFEGGFAGKSGIIINDLTIADSNIVSEATTGAGAFIENADSMEIITLDNCHLINSTVNGSRTGGLVGWVSGYAKLNDGPVKTYVTITGCSVEGCTITGDGSVGGIIGHAGASDYTWVTIDNCTVKNTKLVSTDPDDWRTGVVVGTANNGHVVISNTTASGNTLTQNGETRDASSYTIKTSYGRFVPGETGTLIIDGVDLGERTVVSSADELKEALKTSGADVVLNDDVDATASESSGYGAAGIAPAAGTTFDGNGNTLDVSDANGTWDCAISTTGGTIKNLTINGAFRGIFMGSAAGDVYIDNVVIDDVCYTFNSDGGSKDYGVYISNSTLNGWTSYSDVHKEVIFTNCKFGQGTGGYKYAFCRPYNNSKFVNCVFEEGFEFDTSKTSDIVFQNCYYGDTLITAENAAELSVTPDGATEPVVFFYNDLNGITIQ